MPIIKIHRWPNYN